MNLRPAVLAIGTAIGLFMFVGGCLTMANGTAMEVTRLEYTGTWGGLGVMFGLALLAVLAVAAWDEHK